MVSLKDGVEYLATFVIAWAIVAFVLILFPFIFVLYVKDDIEECKKDYRVEVEDCYGKNY